LTGGSYAAGAGDDTIPLMPAATIRPARPDDAGAVAELFIRTRAACMDYLPRLHTDDETRQFVRDVVFRRCDVWVGEVDGRVAGFLAMHGEWLEHLYVDPTAHNRGAGSALLARAKLLRPRGFRLWVFQRNDQARRFYERHGLTLVRLTDGRDNEEREPDAEYAWLPG
jgi:GNAT superfamily N-acetyltransferase